MPSQDEELSTLDGLSPPTDTDGPDTGFGNSHVPALTIVWHPTLERVGDRALLPLRAGSAGTELSRLDPEFSRPGSSRREPLGDAHVSRKPIRLIRLDNECIRIEAQGSPMRVVVNGSPLGDCRDFSANDLEAGIVLEIASRIVLLLHLDGLRQESEDDLGLVGASLGIERVRREIRQLTSLDVPVLVRGETGTGKELVARALHNTGTRRGRPFVAVNMGAIPPALAASELFGSDKGAFTGARAHSGYFGAAEDGTLFLDEVGEMPLDVQASLLRALDVGEVQTLGASRMRETRARIVAATDADLEVKVQTGAFRGPLLHRLASYELVIPPLRQRRDDIGRLFVHFLRTELERFGKSARIASNQVGLPASFMAALVRHDWPGNVRQLRNVVRQLVLGSPDTGPLDPGPALTALLATNPTPTGGGSPGGTEPGASPTKEPVTPRRSRKPSDVTEEELHEALRACNFDMKATAERLGIPRSSIYNLVDQHKVRRASDLERDEILRCLRECDGNVELTARRLGVSKVALQRRMRELKID
ncbi:sigma 54-interacting transcriptional regulator [Polyangium sp. y55x31]|uniref:sigma 54-interacting transcriptional regulator n=1 Tax=Polyangium sp. y55x31 TaxID=3042688 RepID=UPI0024821BC5|nr:sigma 54-interacting transcriptional regulator [Polyangium sp. y55x31]MDI1482099.1 sigma 54-interacting transcriptional regulator [Polyangium sp. y55x31]